MSREYRKDLEMQVVEREGMVILLFSRRNDKDQLVPAKTDNFILPPDLAIVCAEKMTQMAFECDTGLKPVGETLKASLVQKHRDKLIPRLSVMLNGMREKRTITNGQLATQIMDVVCSEVFS